MKRRMYLRLDSPDTKLKEIEKGTFEITGEFKYGVEDFEKFVQVQFPISSMRYTYLDPSGELEVGDIVEVPNGTVENELAHVVALVHGGFGGLVRPVHARLERRPL